MHAEELLNDIVWLRRVARRLVDDRDDAEDLVQETWLTAGKRAPDQGESWRRWRAKVVRDFVRMRRRGDGRRWAREQAVPAAPASTPEEIVARVETGQRLVDILLALDEPYRGTVLLHFHEGMALA